MLRRYIDRITEKNASTKNETFCDFSNLPIDPFQETDFGKFAQIRKTRISKKTLQKQSEFKLARPNS